jgi:hypothetical protein
MIVTLVGCLLVDTVLIQSNLSSILQQVSMTENIYFQWVTTYLSPVRLISFVGAAEQFVWYGATSPFCELRF